MKNIGLIVICLLFITFSEAKPQSINQGMPWGGLFNATAIGDIVHIGGYPSVLGSNAIIMVDGVVMGVTLDRKIILDNKY